MYTCELCGGLMNKGYLVVDIKLNNPYIVCRECGKASKVDLKK